MTLAQLKKFIATRNRSEFSSNLQFQVDCEESGFSCEDLGDAVKVVNDDGHMCGWRWDTPHGPLYESRDGQLRLGG